MTKLIPNRRTFLTGALPAAGAATLAVPAIASTSPEDRARRAWCEFSEAMNDLTAESDGWTITAGHRPSAGGAYLGLSSVHLDADRQFPSVTVERRSAITLASAP